MDDSKSALVLHSPPTVCPCCGTSFTGSLKTGCVACGVKAVGDPLCRPDVELPTFGRCMLVFVVGLGLMLSVLFTTVALLWEGVFYIPSSGVVFGALGAAAWKLKLTVLPLAIAATWFNWKIMATIRREPAKFILQPAARLGLTLSLTAALVLVLMNVVVIPSHVRSYRMALEAGQRGRLYTIDRALLEYRKRFGTLPVSTEDLIRSVPDGDRSIAQAFGNFEQVGYRPWTELATKGLSPEKPRRIPGGSLRVASLSAGSDVSQSETVSYTNYEIRLPGDDGIFGNEDDWISRDGLIERPTQGDTTQVSLDPPAVRRK